MKITFILPYAGLAGGIKVIAIYAKLLQQRGHDITIVSIPKRSIPLRTKIKCLLKGKGWKSAKTEPSHFDNLNIKHHILEKERPVTNDDVPDADAVIATWWETAEWVDQLHPTKGTKFYFMQDYGAPGQELEKVIPTWHLPLHKITIAQSLVNLIQSHTERMPVDLVLNAIDSQQFQTPIRHRQPQPTAGFLYRSTFSKGADIVFAAFEQVIKQHPDFKLIAFGPEPTPCFKHCNFTYFRQPEDKELPSIYASCDMWLFPSRLEGVGLPIMEALACRTPVIATKAGIAPELVTPQNGLLLENITAECMTEAILAMTTIPDKKWQSLSQQAKETVKDYSWHDATDLFEKSLTQQVKKIAEPPHIGKKHD